MRLSKTFFSSESGRIELLVDVLNVLNDARKRDWCQRTFSVRILVCLTFVDPRRAMVGLTVKVGR
jgi:hypothetical protein